MQLKLSAFINKLNENKIKYGRFLGNGRKRNPFIFLFFPSSLTGGTQSPDTPPPPQEYVPEISGYLLNKRSFRTILNGVFLFLAVGDFYLGSLISLKIEFVALKRVVLNGGP